ncbi:hypothetical protein [Streptomyces sp. NPDC006879]|uniref:hypothetical protein n=1 Tax=Streptomyces sp. NPDC006879 TaxID=3364767 RepID=UPI0036A69997
MTTGSLGSFSHGEHRLLRQRVRDIASGQEGILRAVVHEEHGGRPVRVAYVQGANALEWTTAEGNIEPVGAAE